MCFKKEKIVKEKMVYAFSAFFLVALMGAPVSYAKGGDSLLSDSGASEGLGGSSDSAGSNTAPSGPVGVVVDQADENDSDPSSFEGDSGDMPGERAPEELPMSDAPVDAGMSIE